MHFRESVSPLKKKFSMITIYGCHHIPGKAYPAAGTIFRAYWMKYLFIHKINLLV